MLDTFRHNPINRERQKNEAPSLYIPQWPRQAFARGLLREYAQNVVELTQAPKALLDGGHTVTDIVDYVMEYTWRSKYELVFKDESVKGYALGYRDLILRMGIKESEIEYRTTCARSARNCGVDYWKKEFSLTETSKIKYVSKTWDNYNKLDMGISIKPVFSQFKSKDESREINNLESGSYAVYFLIYIMNVFIAGETY
jgi:hypothetical protein